MCDLTHFQNGSVQSSMGIKLQRGSRRNTNYPPWYNTELRDKTRIGY